MKNRNRLKPSVELLEDRLVPTFNFFTDGLGNVTISGAPDFAAGSSSEPVTITVNPGPTITVTEVGRANPVVTNFPVPGNLTVNFSQSSLNDNVTVDLAGNSLNGNLTVSDGAGADSVSVTSSTGTGTIGGSVTLNNEISANLSFLLIGGNFTLNNAQKNTAYGFTSFLDSIGGNASISEGNGGGLVLFIGGDSIGGNMSVRAGTGIFNAFILPGGDDVGGSLTYTSLAGGNVTLGGTVGKSVYASLGFGPGSVDSFDQQSGSIIGSSLTVLTSFGGGAVTLDGVTAGSAYFSLGNGGQRSLAFNADAAIYGASITYQGTGIGSNVINFDGMTDHSSANFTLGNSPDSFELGAGTNLSSLYINFGLDATGNDTFTNNAGATQPRLYLVNL